ncbi:hypothetical protein AB0I61_17145 [Polymorphospora rubra]|uniref:hypothetical protein n=1 Tax=Polymorphospora rubra TaxID=338584 RepID=UPI0033C159B3
MSSKSRAGRIGALVRWGKTPDRTAATAPARRAASERWLREVQAEFPDIDDATAQKLAEARKRAHMTRIASLPRKRKATGSSGQKAA